MKSQTLFFLLILICLSASAKSQAWQGTYGSGVSVEVEPVQRLQIYPKSDSTLLFSLDLNRGAPSYNMGQLMGEMKLINDSLGVYYYRDADAFYDCRLEFVFLGNMIEVREFTEAEDCGFGYGVYATGRYGEMSIEKPGAFIRADGSEIPFASFRESDWWE